MLRFAGCWIRQACTAKMNLSEEVDLEDYVGRPDKISNAEIAAICQEAGMHAVRRNRYVILPKDFEKVHFFIPSGLLQHNHWLKTATWRHTKSIKGH